MAVIFYVGLGVIAALGLVLIPGLRAITRNDLHDGRPKRPLRKRIWFYKPWPGYLKPDENTFLPKGWWKPWGKGGDEFNWHTILIGHPVIGQICFATRPCPMTGKCAELTDDAPELFFNDWPIDMYGHSHEGECLKTDCYCKETDDDDA